jgi:hypothetical protein
MSTRWQFPPLRSLIQNEVLDFLSARAFSVIHLDAVWDGYAAPLAKKLVLCSEAMPDIGFATIDCDAEQEYARKVSLLNVPTLLYFRGTELVAQVIGKEQDVAANIRKLKAGEQIDS